MVFYATSQFFLPQGGSYITHNPAAINTKAIVVYRFFLLDISMSELWSEQGILYELEHFAAKTVGKLKQERINLLYILIRVSVCLKRTCFFSELKKIPRYFGGLDSNLNVGLIFFKYLLGHRKYFHQGNRIDVSQLLKIPCLFDIKSVFLHPQNIQAKII